MGFGSGSFDPDKGIRGGNPNPDFTGGVGAASRGGFGDEQSNTGVLTSAIPGNPHSSAGFRRALMRTQRSGGKLAGQLPNKNTFGGKGFSKPNAFAQGGQRHGMHIGAGAPAINPAEETGADT